MAERRISENEAFPVYDLAAVDGPFVGRVVEVPDDLLAEYERARSAWETVQEKLAELYEQVHATPPEQWR